MESRGGIWDQSGGRGPDRTMWKWEWCCRQGMKGWEEESDLMPLLSGCQALGGAPASLRGKDPSKEAGPQVAGWRSEAPQRFVLFPRPGSSSVLWGAFFPPLLSLTQPALLYHLYRPAYRVHCRKSGHSGSGQGPGCRNLPSFPAFTFLALGSAPGFQDTVPG